MEPVRIELKLQTPHLVVLAGERVEQELTLVNLTTLPDNFELSIEGLPTGWCSFSSTSVNLFPNWNDAVKFTIEVSPKVRAKIYSGRIVATSKSQPGVNQAVAVEVEVLVPLKAEARLQPRRARGFQGRYNLVVRNRSACDGQVSLQMTNDNPYCAAIFSPAQLRIAAGQSATIGLKVQLSPKAPREQGQQPQNFQVEILPQWFVNQMAVSRPPLAVEGEYIPASRWAFIGRHPWAFGLGFGLLLFILLWVLFLGSNLQNGLASLFTSSVDYGTQPPNITSVRVDQNSFTARANESSFLLKPFVKAQVDFIEKEQDKAQKIELNLTYFGILPATLSGYLDQDEARKGNLKFKADKPSEANSLAWFFVTPTKIVERLDEKLKKSLSPLGQRINGVHIEGSTLFFPLIKCEPDAPACK